MKKRKFSPVFMFIILTFAVMIISFVLSLLNVQAEYSTVNTYTNALQNNVAQVENMLSASGIKYIVTNAALNFVNFEPLAMILIVLIGVGFLERSGFAKSFFTLITQNVRKNTITFIIIFLGIISSLFGNIGFAVLLPLSALLFKYGRRNPLGGIIASFAGICFGYSVNFFLTSIDTSLISLTINASHVIDSSYTFGVNFSMFVMLLATIIISIIMTRITEKVVMPKLGKYEFEEIETLDKVNLSNRELRGLILSIAAALIYILIVIYMIIPGLPLSGGLLDNSATFYIDKLFGPNALFNQGFIFIVMFLFIIIGIVYGLVSRELKSSKDISECLSYSLDGIGKVIVLIFVASLFISVLNKSNIGIVIVSALSNLIGSSSFTGIPLILLLFIIGLIVGLIHPSYLSKWQIMSTAIIPSFMNAGISPELAQIIFVSSSSVTLAFTPAMLYYAVFLAYLSKYDNNDKVSGFINFKYMRYYAIPIIAMWIILILGFYITGLPIGIGSHAALNF